MAIEDEKVLNEGGETEKEVRSRIKEIAKAVDDNYMDMGRLLFRVHAGRYFEEWGYESFGDYVQEEIGFQPRKAKYLVAIWKKFRVDLGVPAAKLRRIGWSKAKEILPVVTEKNFENWLDKARTLKHRELQLKVQKALGKKKSGEEFDTMSFKLAAPQADNVRTAIEQASAESGSEARGHNLDLICTAYLTGKLPPGKRIGWVLRNIERGFGVEVLALKKDPRINKTRVMELIREELKRVKAAGGPEAEAKAEAKAEEAPAEEPPKAKKKKKKKKTGSVTGGVKKKTKKKTKKKLPAETE